MANHPSLVYYVVTEQSAVIQVGRTGPEVRGLRSSFFSKQNFQNHILYEGQIKCYAESCIVIAFKNRPIIRQNTSCVVENASL